MSGKARHRHRGTIAPTNGRAPPRLPRAPVARSRATSARTGSTFITRRGRLGMIAPSLTKRPASAGSVMKPRPKWPVGVQPNGGRRAMNLAALSPEVREAAERFERETGRRLDGTFGPGPVDEAMLGVFLIVNGYAPAGHAGTRAPSSPRLNRGDVPQRSGNQKAGLPEGLDSRAHHDGQRQAICSADRSERARDRLRKARHRIQSDRSEASSGGSAGPFARPAGKGCQPLSAPTQLGICNVAPRTPH